MKWGAFGILLWFLIHQISIVYDGLTDEEVKVEMMVILGNKVKQDGTLSLRLKARLDKGVALYNQGLAPMIVVSGGLGKEGHFEGTKMAEYLIQNGVEKERIKIDNQGNTTQLTAANFKKLFPKVKKVMIVSQFYHISRTKLAFRKQGVTQVYGVHCDYFEWRDAYSLFREFFGYYKYLFLN